MKFVIAREVCFGWDLRYILLITGVSVRYGEIFHEPKPSEIACHISQLTNVISNLFI